MLEKNEMRLLHCLASSYGANNTAIGIAGKITTLKVHKTDCKDRTFVL